MIWNEIVAPEGVGDDLVQIVSTKHVDEYVALPAFHDRHVDATVLLAKAEEAALRAYEEYTKRRAPFQGVAKSESTGLAIVFSMEPQSKPHTVAFVIISAMIKSSFAPKHIADVLIKISSKKMTFDGKPCVEIGRNVYTYEDGFAFDTDANTEGALQDLVVADVQVRTPAPGFCGWLSTPDEVVNYAAEVDIHGNVCISRAWWKNLLNFSKIAVS